MYVPNPARPKITLFSTQEQKEKIGAAWNVRESQNVRQRQSKAGGTPEDYQDDLQQICPPGQLDQRLDRDQRSS